MKYVMLMFMLVALSVNANCQKCERVREENARKAKDQDWVFYEDWLEKHGDEEPLQPPIAPADDKKNK